jgi:peptidyl-dipeptidase Dcp
MIKNPLLNEFRTQYESVPFNEIKTEHYLPAFNVIIEECRKGLEKISKSPEKPTFLNTIESLEFLNHRLKRLEQIFFNLNSAETNSEIQRIAQEISPNLTAYYNDITLNENLFVRVKQVYNENQGTVLNTEESKLLEDTFKMFVRNGANLAPDEKELYRKYTGELAKLTLKFEENLLTETNSYQLTITTVDDLSGLPEYAREAATMEAKSRNVSGWVFTLKAPSFTPFMKYADKRELREQMYRAYSTRCFKNDDRDNQEIIKRIADLRRMLANLLGYETFAQYVLEERMAQKPDKVYDFLNNLLTSSMPVAKQEFTEVQEYARKHGADFEIQRWDWAYYSEKLKDEKFSITDEMTKPYFRLEKVESEIFNLASRLYGITLVPDNTIPRYHKDVKTFRILDHDGSYLALLYTDYFPRDGKQGGAWMTNYLEQYFDKEKDVRPHVSLVLNFTKPGENKPSLLTYEEVRTFLHEFGHALHSILSKCTYLALSGTNVYRDFVELPSQIMENWAEQKEWLSGVALHFETGERMPDEMLVNIIKSRNFNSGYAFIRQLSFGLNDMAWHTLKSTPEIPIVDFEMRAMSSAELFTPVHGTCFSTGFHHIFGGGYAAGYYGYKWAEVLDADSFSLFRQKGIFNREVAQSFRENILSRGGTENPMELYKRFRGQEPSLEPILVRSGLM